MGGCVRDGCHTDWKSDLGEIAQSVRFLQLIVDNLGQVFSWDELCERVDSLCRSSEQSRRRKGQDEGDGVCEDHCRSRYFVGRWAFVVRRSEYYIEEDWTQLVRVAQLNPSNSSTSFEK